MLLMINDDGLARRVEALATRSERVVPMQQTGKDVESDMLRPSERSEKAYNLALEKQRASLEQELQLLEQEFQRVSYTLIN